MSWEPGGGDYIERGVEDEAAGEGRAAAAVGATFWEGWRGVCVSAGEVEDCSGVVEEIEVTYLPCLCPMMSGGRMCLRMIHGPLIKSTSGTIL